MSESWDFHLYYYIWCIKLSLSFHKLVRSLDKNTINNLIQLITIENKQIRNILNIYTRDKEKLQLVLEDLFTNRRNAIWENW